MATGGTCDTILRGLGDIRKDQLRGETVKQHLEGNGGNANGWITIEACVRDYDQNTDKTVEEVKKQYEKEKKALYSGTSVATGSIGAGTAGLVAGIPTGLWLIPKVISWIK